MSVRPTTDHDRAALKAAVRALIRACGNQEQAAMATRVGQSTLSRYGSIAHANEHIPLDVLMDLTMDADDPNVVRLMCRLASGVYVPLPKPSLVPRNWTAALGAAVKSGGEAADTICRALNDDGQITPEEITDFEVVDKLSAAIEALAVLQIYAAQVAGEAGT
ncbi:MAG: hypothetical protein JJ902_18330 [Roseibium sp.]|nr:hypothetical protein [Roseibium sp.]